MSSSSVSAIFFADIGIAYGLIQRKQVTDLDIRYVFTWQMIIGALVSFAVAVLSGPLAELFKEPRAEHVLIAMAPICFIQAATAVSLNLLKRNLDFKTLQICQGLGYLVGYLMVGVPLALAGWQVMSLVIAWLVQSIVTFFLLFSRVKHPTKPLINHPDAKSMTGFAFKVLATNITNWMISNIDRVVVARHYPSIAVGLYTTPYNLMYTPTTTLMGVIQPVMYSACSKVQGDRQRISDAYLILVAAICLFIMPIFFTIAMIADTFILSLYGEEWKEAAVVLKPIALAMPLYMLWVITTPPLWTNSHPGLELKMQVPMAVIWFVAVLVAAQYTISVVAWTVFSLVAIRLGVFVFAAATITGASLIKYLQAAQGGFFASLALASLALIIDNSMIASPPTRMVIIILACMVVWLALVKLIPSFVYQPLAELLCQYESGTKGKFAGFIKLHCTKRRDQN